MATSGLTTTLARDGNKEAIQIAQTLKFDDGTSYSPKASVGTSGQAFLVPTGALAFNFKADATAYVNLSGTYDGTHGYWSVPANTQFTFPCTSLAGSNIYVASASSTVTVTFFFEMGA